MFSSFPSEYSVSHTICQGGCPFYNVCFAAFVEKQIAVIVIVLVYLQVLCSMDCPVCLYCANTMLVLVYGSMLCMKLNKC